MLVVDASIVMKLLTCERNSTLAMARVIGEPDRTAPDWLQTEIASALSKKVRYAGLPMEVAYEAFAALPSIMPELVQSTPYLVRAMGLSVELSHALYDCLYLALALETGGTMLTADQKFFAVVEQSAYRGKVEILS